MFFDLRTATLIRGRTGMRHDTSGVLQTALLTLSLLFLVPSPAWAQQSGKGQFEEAAPPEPVRVTVGAYVNDIQHINLESHSYAVDIYLWFRWRDRTVSPTESVEMVNPFELWGHTTELIYDEPEEISPGEFYQVLRIQGRFSKKFLLTNFPYDRQELIVEFEDSQYPSNRLIYEPDSSPLTVNPRLVLPGFHVSTPRLEIETFQYPTAFGDPRLDRPHSYSRARIKIPIARPIVTYSVKLLLPITCVVLCASLMLLIRATYVDARVGIGITSLLTVVALQLSSNQQMPSVDYLVLMDKIYISAYVYILAALAVVLYTARLVDAQHLDRAEKLQRRLFALLTGLFVLSSLIIVGTGIRGG